MKKFNICKTYGQTLLRGTRNAVELPKNCFYGKDEAGLWYCLERKPPRPDKYLYELREHQYILELYRFKNGEWYRGNEYGDTVDMIVRIANKCNYWFLPLEKCLHMHSAVKSMDKTIGSRRKAASGLKEVSKNRAEIGTYGNARNVLSV